MGEVFSYFDESQPENVAASENNKSSSNDKTVMNTKVRDTMFNYWEEHAEAPLTNSLMMLMSSSQKAERFAEQEKAEILSHVLPIIESESAVSVVELGAGIGRFTGSLAQHASSLLAVDFCQKFISENEREHAHLYPQIDFVCNDVCKLVLDDGSYYLVFSNWLFMYLADDEVRKVARSMYNWCAVGGYVFFRESCEGGASGDKPRKNNPTFYRNKAVYESIFDGIQGLQKVHVKQVRIYVQQKEKTNQFCFLYQKTH